LSDEILNNQYGEDIKNNPSKITLLKKAVKDVERELIWKALKLHKTTRKAAKALGISQSTVVRKCKELGINNSN
jgi:transcriptional regulator with PAS, ATPase and Fis domain